MLMQPTQETLRRLADLMRIISALFIFYYHAGIFISLPLSRYGDFAVNTFIILAVVASMAFTSVREESTFTAYIWQRIKRIFPIYFAINLAIFAASFLYPSRLGQPFTFRQFILSSLGLSIAFGDRFLSEVFWFIPFIFQVYVLLYSFRKRVLRVNWPAVLILAFVVTAIEITLFSGMLGDAMIQTRKWSPLLRLPEVLFGAMTAAFVADILPLRRYITSVAIYAACAGVLAVGALATQRAAYLFALPLNGLSVTAIITALSAGALLLIDGSNVSTHTLRFAGRATFPFFLIHGAGMRFLASHWHSAPALWFAYLASCILVAVLFELVFRPALRPSR